MLAKSDKYLACGIRMASVNSDYSMVITGGRGARVTDAGGMRLLTAKSMPAVQPSSTDIRNIYMT